MGAGLERSLLRLAKMSAPSEDGTPWQRPRPGFLQWKQTRGCRMGTVWGMQASHLLGMRDCQGGGQALLQEIKTELPSEGLALALHSARGLTAQQSQGQEPEAPSVFPEAKS